MQSMIMSETEFEDYLDTGKAAILNALVNEDLLDKKVAEEWCALHTVILKKKSIFRTFTDKWRKEKIDTNKSFFLVVKKVS